MNRFAYLIEVIKREIPPQILQAAFCPTQIGVGGFSFTIDHALRSTIIENWVLRDLNVLSGQEVTVDLAGAYVREVIGGTIVEIPPGLTAGRQISSVLSIIYSNGSQYIPAAGSIIAEGHLGPIQVSDSRIQLTGPNTVFVQGGLVSGTSYLRCCLENESDLGNLHPRSLDYYGELCVLAAKAYIYNEMTIRLEGAYINAGVSIGRFAEIVNEWSDSIEIYKEERKKARKIGMMQDRTSHQRAIRMGLPPA